jgi:hypothetical protein
MSQLTRSFAQTYRFLVNEKRICLSQQFRGGREMTHYGGIVCLVAQTSDIASSYSLPNPHFGIYPRTAHPRKSVLR